MFIRLFHDVSFPRLLEETNLIKKNCSKVNILVWVW